MADRDVKEDPHRRERDDQARAAVGDERERNSRQRRQPHHGGDVDRGLAADEDREPGRERLAEGVAAAQGDAEADVSEGRVRGDQCGGAHQPQLLADDREDHVRVCLGEEVRLFDALAKPAAEESYEERTARLAATLNLKDLDLPTRALLLGKGFVEGNHGEPGQFVVEKAFAER